MIPHEEFTYGQLTNYKIKPDAKKIKQLLKQQSLDYLTSLTLRDTQQSTVFQNYFQTEDIITFTHIYRTQDSYGRPCENNHTILIKVHDYLEAYPPPVSLVEPLFKMVKNV